MAKAKAKEPEIKSPSAPETDQVKEPETAESGEPKPAGSVVDGGWVANRSGLVLGVRLAEGQPVDLTGVEEETIAFLSQQNLIVKKR